MSSSFSDLNSSEYEANVPYLEKLLSSNNINDLALYFRLQGNDDMADEFYKDGIKEKNVRSYIDYVGSLLERGMMDEAEKYYKLIMKDFEYEIKNEYKDELNDLKEHFNTIFKKFGSKNNPINDSKDTSVDSSTNNN